MCDGSVAASSSTSFALLGFFRVVAGFLIPVKCRLGQIVALQGAKPEGGSASSGLDSIQSSSRSARGVSSGCDLGVEEGSSRTEERVEYAGRALSSIEV